MMEPQFFFSSKNQASFSSLTLSAFSPPSDNIPCSPSGHEVEIHNALCPHNQKNTVSITFTLHQTCRAFSGLVDVSETHCKEQVSLLTSQP